MTHFKRCFVILFTLIILCFCCSCSTSDKVLGLYQASDTMYWEFAPKGVCNVYTPTYSTPDTFYLSSTMEYRVKGNQITFYTDYPEMSETFDFSVEGDIITLTPMQRNRVLTFSRVDSSTVQFDETRYHMTISANDTAEETLTEADSAFTRSALKDEPTVEMNTHYPIYKSKAPVIGVYIEPDAVTQEVANIIEAAYEDFLLDVVLNDDDTSWMDDCDYTWNLDVYSKGVYTISIRLVVPDGTYGYMKHEISSVITFDEYGYYEVSNFNMESCPVG